MRILVESLVATLTQSHHTDNKIIGLDAGTDDYVRKPLVGLEIVACILNRIEFLFKTTNRKVR